MWNGGKGKQVDYRSPITVTAARKTRDSIHITYFTFIFILRPDYTYTIKLQATQGSSLLCKTETNQFNCTNLTICHHAHF